MPAYISDEWPQFFRGASVDAAFASGSVFGTGESELLEYLQTLSMEEIVWVESTRKNPGYW
jgi:hypothetical protein